MTSKHDGGLLTSRDAQPVRLTNPDGRSRFLLLGDHSGNCVPEQLSGLGLGEGDLNRHIALDLGIAKLGAALADLLDATFIEQRYSRLVIDCNRNPGSEEFIVQESDGTPIIGNAQLSETKRAQRRGAIFWPYHEAIADLVTKRQFSGRDPIIISLHSFTPILLSRQRPWEIGVLYDGGDIRFATHVLDALRSRDQFVIGDNQPYQMDATDFTIPYHAYPRRCPYVEIEVRQDMLEDPPGQGRIAAALVEAFLEAMGS